MTYSPMVANIIGAYMSTAIIVFMIGSWIILGLIYNMITNYYESDALVKARAKSIVVGVIVYIIIFVLPLYCLHLYSYSIMS